MEDITLNPQPITNLGTPFKNIDFNYVGTGTNAPIGFQSTVNPAKFGITPEFASNNVASADASRLQNGGGSYGNVITQTNSMFNDNYNGGSRRKKIKQPISSINSSDVSVKTFRKNIKKKMKIISNKYKNMKGKKSMSLKKIKSKFKSLFRTMKSNLKVGVKKPKTSRRNYRSKSRKNYGKVKKYQKGGYHQYMGNVVNTPGYSVAGSTLSPQNLGEANPPPITRYINGGDNYNHFTNKSQQLWN
jgi:hypothetical protein